MGRVKFHWLRFLGLSNNRILDPVFSRNQWPNDRMVILLEFVVKQQHDRGSGSPGTELATPPIGETAPCWEKFTICRGIVTDDNTFIFCANYEYLLLI